MEKKGDDTFGSTVRRELVAFKLMPYPVCMFAGVCAAIAYRLAIPTWIVRLVCLAVILSTGIGILAYILLAIFVPDADAVPQDYAERTGDTSK